MKKLLMAMAIMSAGCIEIKKPEMPFKRYTVVSVFDEVVLTTDDEAEAYKTAHHLTLMGRMLASKPQYFVKETNEKGVEKTSSGE